MSATLSTSLDLFDGASALRDIFRSAGTAVSPEAGGAELNRKHVAHLIEDSTFLYGEKSSALSALRALFIDHACQDWDGEGARPISVAAFRNAELFIRVFPDDLPLPEFAPEPDGAISFDWIQSRYKALSASIGPRPRLAYAWLDGSDTGHAVEYFDGERIPYRLLNEIRRTMLSASVSH